MTTHQRQRRQREDAERPDQRGGHAPSASMAAKGGIICEELGANQHVWPVALVVGREDSRANRKLTAYMSRPVVYSAGVAATIDGAPASSSAP